MNPKRHHWRRWAVVLVMTCFLPAGFPAEGDAQDTQSLTIEKIKPVPKLERRRSVQTGESLEEGSQERYAAGEPLDGIFPERKEIIIGDGSLKLSPDVTYVIGDRSYSSMPPGFKEGSRVTYSIDEKTGMVTQLRLHEGGE